MKKRIYMDNEVNIEKTDNTFWDSYEVVETIGKGSQGVVMKAKLNRNPTSYVAIKSYQMDEHDDDFRYRFNIEIQALNKLKGYKNIVQIVEAYESNSELSIVTEFVNGPEGTGKRLTLKNYILKVVGKKIKIRKALDFIIKLSHAIANAHHFNFIHRDLKPDNILVDFNEDPVIVDWGLAYPKNDYRSIVGLVRGNRPYSAPEQLYGLSPNIDERADVYALGGILWFILTGKTPIRGRDGHLNFPQNEIPEDLFHVISKACESNREKRYYGVPELYSVLKHLEKRYSNPYKASLLSILKYS